MTQRIYNLLINPHIGVKIPVIIKLCVWLYFLSFYYLETWDYHYILQRYINHTVAPADAWKVLSTLTKVNHVNTSTKVKLNVRKLMSSWFKYNSLNGELYD